MFYRIRNHIFNLDKVVDICIKGDIIIISMDNGANVNISLNGIDSDEDLVTIFSSELSLDELPFEIMSYIERED